MRKRLFAVLLALTLAAGLCGCADRQRADPHQRSGCVPL